MCLMQEGRKCHLRPSCTNFRQMCVMQERHKCLLRLSCIKQLISFNSPCFGFTPTVHTKNSFKWNIKTNYKHILGTILNITTYPVFYNGKQHLYSTFAFRHFHNGYCKNVISGTCDPLALTGNCGLHL